MAAARGVTERTLRNWAKIDPTVPVLRGRPPHSKQSEEEARELVRAQLERMGWSTGEPTLLHELKGRVPQRLLRKVLVELKAEHRERLRRHREEGRVSIDVHARDAIWTLDATHLGRDPQGGAVEGEVVREVASSKILHVAVGPPSTGLMVVVLLELLRLLRGGLPLVLITDNGPAYRSALVKAYLRRHRVVHILNEPHTPQHNAWGERANGELKAETGLGRGVRLRDHEEPLLVIAPALERLNTRRPRASRGWLTPDEAYEQIPPWSALVDRHDFWARTHCAIARAVVGCKGKRALRHARREAQLATLECFGLITRTRGKARRKASIAETFS